MSTQSQRFQTFVTRLRPHRIAILIKADEPNWQKTCLRIIGFLSQVWGGYHSLIVPTDGNIIEEPFWQLLSAFDPDIIYRYQKSGADMAADSPEHFEGEVHSLAKSYTAGGMDDQAAQETARDNLLKGFTENFSISTELARQLRIRVAPFHIGTDYIVHYIGRNDVPSYPLTAVANIVNNCDVAPDYVFDVWNDAPTTLSLPPSLWLLADSGVATPEHQRRLDESGVKTVPHQLINATEADLIQIGITPYKSFQENSPFGLTRLALKAVRSSQVSFLSEPFPVVFGETLKDFCLYYALARLLPRAIWLPSWFEPKDKKAPTRMVAALRQIQGGHFRPDCKFAFLSLSKDSAELSAFVSESKRLLSMCTINVEDAADIDFIRSLVQHPLRWYIARNVERITTHQLVDGKLPGTFESPVPTPLNEIDATKHSWIVEVTFLNHLIPRHPALARSIASGYGLGDVRASNDGIVYHVPGHVTMGADIELQLLRPTIVVPEAEELFRIAFNDCGYETAVSDKGTYADETIHKFGDLEEMAKTLRHQQYGALLNKCIDTKKPARGVHDEGDVIDDRRYMNFDAILKIVPDKNEASAIIDKFITKKIFYRGLSLGCSRCSHLDWFGIDEVSQEFTCRRCGTQQTIVRRSWREPHEPSWYYKLDEIVFQFLNHDGDVTVRTLDVMRQRHLGSFIYAPELRITKKGEQKPYMEIDVCCVADGKIYIGECKSNDSLKTDEKLPAKVAKRYREIAQEIGAFGVIFSTSQSAWDEASKKAIEDEFGNYPQFKVVKMYASHL